MANLIGRIAKVVSYGSLDKTTNVSGFLPPLCHLFPDHGEECDSFLAANPEYMQHQTRMAHIGAAVRNIVRVCVEYTLRSEKRGCELKYSLRGADDDG